MKIIIDYEASWRNSFLDGSNNEPLPKKGRNFVGSMTELKKPANYYPREISKDTVMGVLSRLIGDQRKLYQARQSDSYYFADMEDAISFEDKPSVVNQEMTYIRNIKGSTDQNSFTGMIKSNISLLDSEFSTDLLSVLFLDFDKLVDFICNDTPLDRDLDIRISPFAIADRCQSLKKMDINKIERETGVNLEKINSAIKELLKNEHLLKTHFPKSRTKFSDIEYVSKTQVNLPSIYFSALYLKGLRLKEKDPSIDFSLSGFSVRNFTKKDFMKICTTGKQKNIYGNPYVREERIKGKGKTKHILKKVSGQLEIQLDIDLQKAKELKQLIDYAGVPSFFLGKKGLAYVSDIRLR